VNEVVCPLQYVFYHKAAYSREQYMCIKLCFKLGTPAEESVRRYRTDTDISEVLLCIGTRLLSHFVVNADEMFV